MDRLQRFIGFTQHKWTKVAPILPTFHEMYTNILQIHLEKLQGNVIFSHKSKKKKKKL